jgi:hypothetical protein
MTTMEMMHQDQPTYRDNVRMTRGLTKAAVIATSADAERCMVVTLANLCGEDYHLVHVLECAPRQAASCLSSHQVVELRPTSVQRLHDSVKAFMEGEDPDQLIEISSGRAAPAAGRWCRWS